MPLGANVYVHDVKTIQTTLVWIGLGLILSGIEPAELKTRRVDEPGIMYISSGPPPAHDGE
jgi:hypothetical protein